MSFSPDRSALAAWWGAVARGRQDPRGLGLAVAGCLVLLSVVYGIGVAAFLWARSLRRSHAAVPVISVGNMVVGGTGKTPLVVYLARQLSAAGTRVAIVSRGHGRRSRGTVVVSRGDGPLVPWSEAGDEPYLMALLTKGVPVVVSERRVDAVSLAVSKAGASAILLDDGFQHVGLARDLDIVAADALAPLGNGHLLPGGVLREHPLGIRRADVIVATRCDASREGARRVAGTLGALAPRAAFVETRMVVAELWDVATGAAVAPGELRDVPVLALSSIADPSGFAATAVAAGLTVVDRMVFPDHCDYTRADLDAVSARVRATGAAAIVTTEKDAVRLTGWSPPARLVALGIDLEVTRGRQQLMDAVARAIERGGKDA